MELVLLALAALGGGGALAAKKVRDRREQRRGLQVELEGVRRLADEDVTLFGEQLRHLDGEVAGREGDEAVRWDCQRALDAYEAAQREVQRLEHPEEISKVTDTLASGRYALACVQARIAGRELPEMRVPCFFNPQHGPSVTDVVWTSPRTGTRTVPACAQDAARVAAREKPDVRMVRLGNRTVPYWEAGAAYLPYGRGYFPTTSLGMATGLAWAFDAHVPGPAASAGGDQSGSVTDSGGFTSDFGADWGEAGH
jgi:hypothetical protein